MRKLIYILACSIGLLLLGYTAYRGYLVWRENRLMTMTRAYLAKADAKNALLSLQQLIHTNPRNLEATRLMACLMESSRSPTAVAWWRRVLELNPKSFEDRISLVKAALIYQDVALATNTLAGVAPADQNTSNYQETAGDVSLVLGKVQEADAHFSEALRLDPSNPLNSFNLAKLRLRSTNTLDMAEARINLKRVILNSTNASLVSLARRELIADALRLNDWPAALSLTRESAQTTNATFQDLLLRLEVLLKANDPGFRPTLARYQREATNSPANLFELANWQINRLSPGETLGWLQSLPTGMRTNLPAALLIAQCRMAMMDWKGTQDLLQPQNWGDWDFERHALLARSLREQHFAESSKAEWQAALNATQNRLIGLKTLLNLTQQLHWNNEMEEILWRIVNFYPNENNAWMTLRQNLIDHGRTRSLLQLTSIESGRYPSELWLKNDLALAALLLNADEMKPHDLAREAYQRGGTNPSVASTYAFSLYLKGKPAEALNVMQQLKPKDLSDPEIAGYYGLVLKATGHKSQATAYFQLSAKAQLLPEERALFDKAASNP